jgi:hypothetical protein
VFDTRLDVDEILLVSLEGSVSSQVFEWTDY